MAMLRLKPSRAAQDLKAPRASTLRDPQPAGEPSDVDRVYGEIFDAAMDRRLLPGAKLTESALCAAFEFSRGTVRTALARLAHDEIVAIEPNRGAYVWQAAPKEVRDVFAMRRALECVVIDMLAALDDVADRLAPLHGMVEREQRAFEQGDRISWLRLSNAFHVELARLLDNQVSTEMLAGLCAPHHADHRARGRPRGQHLLVPGAQGHSGTHRAARRPGRARRHGPPSQDSNNGWTRRPGSDADPWAALQRQPLTPSI